MEAKGWSFGGFLKYLNENAKKKRNQNFLDPS